MRAVARYLDEALDVYEAVNYYAEADRPGEASRLRGLAGPDLLFQLPRVQRLLLRLADCAPGGAAAGDPVVQAALLTLVKESFKAYRAASEGLINLADKFFDMDVASARSALEAYRAAVVVTARLQAFYRAAEAAHSRSMCSFKSRRFLRRSLMEMPVCTAGTPSASAGASKLAMRSRSTETK